MDKRHKDKKIAETSMRVLDLLKNLCKNPLDSEEIIQEIEETSEKIYRKEIVTKYLNTLKLLGLKIKKINNKYTLENTLEKIDFSKEELSLIKFLEKYSKETNHESLHTNVCETLQIIEKSFSKKTTDLLKDEKIKTYKLKNYNPIQDINLKAYEKYCREDLKIEIVYKDLSDNTEKKYKVTPLKIKYKKDNPLLVCYDCKENVYREFLIKNITKSIQTPQKNTKDYPSSVTFKLKGKLAKNYVLKNEEKIIEQDKDYIIVSNTKEDRNILLRRLIRYYDKCEVLYPKEFRNSMIQKLQEIENLYKG